MIKIPANVEKALSLLHGAGFEAYVVGGCVRDSLLGHKPTDWDITTSALPEDTLSVFSDYKTIETGIKHGTVTVIIDDIPIEITTYRVDGEYLDNRHPSSVTFTRSLTQDLARRDFTINAMAYDGELIDLFGGQIDLQMRIIKCVGNAKKRFSEDALRILRALRFASILGFKIDPATSDAIHDMCLSLQSVSKERITEELLKFLEGEMVTSLLLEYKDVFATILPCLAPCIDFSQMNKHHMYDVYSHIAFAVGTAPSDATVRLALLLHDVGKPSCFTVEDGVGHAYGHEEAGAIIAETALRENLRLSSSMLSDVVTLVRNHDYHLDSSLETVLRALGKFGPDLLHKLVFLEYGDMMAHSGSARNFDYYCILKAIDTAIEARFPCRVTDLDINGEDLVKLGFSGPAIGETLSELLEMVISGNLENVHDKLIERVKEIGTGKA